MNFSNKTLRYINEYKENGFQIIIGNNPYLNKAKKYRDYKCIRISQTNSKTHGYSIRTVWAIKKV